MNAATTNWEAFPESISKQELEDQSIPGGMTAQEFWDRCRMDRRFYFKHCLLIRVKNPGTGRNEMIPFVLNPEQDEVLKYIEEQERKKLPVRIIILKSRKIGFSTLIEALGHHLCQFKEHVIARCVAHRKESTEDIFEITHRYQEYLHPAIRAIAPGKGKRSSRDMGVYWNHGSQFEVQTQGATDADRGNTPDFLHLSELGLWWKRRKTSSDSEVLQASMGSVEDIFGTYVIIESTACGSAGAFYDRFWAAWKGEPGNMFKAFFFGWQDHSKYQLKPKSGERSLDSALRKAHKAGDDEAFWRHAKKLAYSPLWAERAITFNLKPWQVRWALRSVTSKFGGNLKSFDTEFPLSPEIAFTSSSTSPFKQDSITQRMRNLEDKPVDVDVYGSITYNKRTGESTWMAGPPAWRVWFPPEEGHEYIVTVDSAHGVEDGDYTCIQVGDRTDRKQVAEYYYRLPPLETAQQTYAVGMMYNQALVVPEIDGPGLATTQNLLECDGGAGYSNLYVRSKSGNWTQRFGFRTGTKNVRDACISALAEIIQFQSWDIYSKILLRECQTFVKPKGGKCEAMPGEHDDAVMAMAIMMYVDKSLGDIEEPLSAEVAPARDPIFERFFGDGDSDIDQYLGGIW